MSKASVDKGTVKELAGTLQNVSLPPSVRISAAESILNLSKNEQGCAMLCSSSAIHALLSAIKEHGDSAELLRIACRAICNLYKFDGKLVAVVARLQGAIEALLGSVRAHTHGPDRRLLQWLLCALSDVSHTGHNTAALVRASGLPIVLGALLAHLKVEHLALPCLYVLVNVARTPAHVPLLVAEGGVPALLAALVAHLGHALLVRTALTLLRALVVDDASVLTFAGDGAYRIVLAVIQAHAPDAERLDVVKLAASVLWRMYYARHPMGGLLQAWSVYDTRSQGAQGGALSDGTQGENTSSADEEDADAAAAAAAAPAEPDATASSAAPGGGGDGGSRLPRAEMVLGGPDHSASAHPPAEPTLEACSALRMAERVAQCIALDAERLVYPTGRPDQPRAPAPPRAGGAPLPGYVPHAPPVVYDACAPGAGAAAGGESAGGAPGCLRFSSGFESANLRRAIRVREREYDLVLACDANTRGHTQWFYFGVAGMVPGVPYKLNIVNLLKSDSLFAHGMRPLLYSTTAAARHGSGWVRVGADICYYQNEHPVRPDEYAAAAQAGWGARKKRNAKDKADAATYYTLTFTVVFEHGGDDELAYIAQCYPYTYSQLTATLAHLQAKPDAPSRLRVETLCSSLAGHAVHVLTITDFLAPPEEIRARRTVVLTARVHPGESNASWMMDGLLRALLADSRVAAELRSALVFRIVPCLNPDGVILGNYRCSLSGEDLNRSWAEPQLDKHPTIHATKELIARAAADESLLLFCDLHGHSRKKAAFMYGVEAAVPRGEKGAAPQAGGAAGAGAGGSGGGGSGAGGGAGGGGGGGGGGAASGGASGAAAAAEAGKGGGGASDRPARPPMHERVFPLLLSRLSPTFAFGSCSFKVLRSKEATGRVVVSRTFSLVHSYTLEASFCGPDGPLAEGAPELHYSTADLQGLGHAFVQALHAFAHPSRTEYNKALAELEEGVAAAGGGNDGSDEDGEAADKPAGTRRKSVAAGGGGSGGGGGAAPPKVRKKPSDTELSRRRRKKHADLAATK